MHRLKRVRTKYCALRCENQFYSVTEEHLNIMSLLKVFTSKCTILWRMERKICTKSMYFLGEFQIFSTHNLSKELETDTHRLENNSCQVLI